MAKIAEGHESDEVHESFDGYEGCGSDKRKLVQLAEVLETKDGGKVLLLELFEFYKMTDICCMWVKEGR